MFVFPKWFNSIRVVIAVVVVVGGGYAASMFALAASPKTTDVGYQPIQPVPYSHKLHVTELGMDCRYCHNTVQQAAHAAIPPTQVCMNCHANIRANSAKLRLVRESNTEGKPIEWIRVHDLPDYSYFDHSAHVGRIGWGIGCTTCHGRVDKMGQERLQFGEATQREREGTVVPSMEKVYVYQVETLSMGWCLECHRNPERYLRPASEVFNMGWQAADQMQTGTDLKSKYNVNPSTDCNTCHR